jgi:hypothetical protein
MADAYPTWHLNNNCLPPALPPQRPFNSFYRSLWRDIRTGAALPDAQEVIVSDHPLG